MAGPSRGKSLIALGALLFFIAAMVLVGMGIFELNRTKNDSIGLKYIIPAELMNTLSVIFLIYLTMIIPENSSGYKLFILILLITGLIIEVYLTVYSEDTATSVFAYLVMVINFIFRGFLVLQYVQLTGWESPVFPELKSIVESMKPTPTPKSESEPATQRKTEESKPTESKSDASKLEEIRKDYKPLLRALIEKIKEKNPDVDDKTVELVRNRMGIRVKQSGKFGKEEIKEVNEIIKNKDGSDIKPVFSV